MAHYLAKWIVGSTKKMERPTVQSCPAVPLIRSRPLAREELSGLLSTLNSAHSHHETIEEPRKLLKTIQREHMRDILIGPDDHHAAVFAIDATQGEDVVAAP